MNQQLQGRAYWRSLDELARSPRVLEMLRREFSGYAPGEVAGLSRRRFLRLMGASMALAGITLGGCRRWPEQEVRPHSSRPENTAPGTPQYYATMIESAGVATGLLVKSYDGRPIKIDGNPRHPFSLGASDARAQASLLELYDPDRSRRPLLIGHDTLRKPTPSPRTWDDFTLVLKQTAAALRSAGGAGFVILSRPTSSPTLHRLREQVMKVFPAASWHTYEPIHRDAEIEGSKLAFGKPLRPQYRLDKAPVIACFDADLLGQHPAQLRHARDWASARQSDTGQVNRLYAIESDFTLTGSIADHRLPVRPSRVLPVLQALARNLGLQVATTPLTDQEHRFAALLAADLAAHRGRSVVAVGSAQNAAVHALGHCINHALGNIGSTLQFIDEPQADSSLASLRGLADNIRTGAVSTILILDGNPVYDAPADLRFDLAPPEGKSLLSIHLAPYFDETSARCRWHLPMAHPLECWGDGRAWDGTYGVQQPLIEPLFGEKSSAEVLAMLLGMPETAGRTLVQQTAGTLLGERDFDARWDRLLRDGVLADSGSPPVAPPAPSLPAFAPAMASAPQALEIQFVPSRALYDGRHANNGWLQELPDPLTRLTWDNAALISKADADARNITTGDLISLRTEGARQELEIAAYVMPGLAAGTIILPLGYGRTIAGHVGGGVGFDTYRLRTTSGNGYRGVVESLRRTERTYALAATQEHHLVDAVGMWGREVRIGRKGQSGELIHEASAAEFIANPRLFQKHKHVALPLYNAPSRYNQPHAWGMSIDLDRCIGCSACVVSCQAENNIPIVGKEQVANSREMHWLRIDRYFKGPVENPDVVFAPLSCAQCENAPCEQVCPVAATVHDAEGLNTMVYNRCIGTRYCSNNCPFKVRRFNYFDFQSADPRGRPAPWLGIPDEQQKEQIDPIKKMIFNPDVTVRMRGVMEKCTYCVQRLQAAKVKVSVAFAQGESPTDTVADGAVTTACQDACPTQAITFGNLNDAASDVATRRASPRAYSMLEELNLGNRTQYLAKFRNPAGAPANPTNEPHA